jgi:hypothetical protein
MFSRFVAENYFFFKSDLKIKKKYFLIFNNIIKNKLKNTF